MPAKSALSSLQKLLHGTAMQCRSSTKPRTLKICVNEQTDVVTELLVEIPASCDLRGRLNNPDDLWRVRYGVADGALAITGVKIDEQWLDVKPA